MATWAELAENNPYPFAAKMAAKKGPSLDDLIADSPMTQLQLEQQAQSQREQNARQRAQNQNARQQSQERRAGLQLDQAQFQFQTQQGVANLAQELMRQRIQELLARQNATRTLYDQSGRLIDTRFNVQRQDLLDQLRLHQQRQDLNRLVDTSQSRARRLIGA